MKRTFKTPEGRFQLIQERNNGCSFSSQRPTRLTLARLNFGQQQDSVYVIFNVQECLHICYYAAIDKVGTSGAGLTQMCMVQGKPHSEHGWYPAGALPHH